MTASRERKHDYGSLPIDIDDPHFHEPLVDIADYGIAGQAYYSRPNAATTVAVPGVLNKLYLRKSVAETVRDINVRLGSAVVTHFFGGEVELYVEDALRPVSVQAHLHDELIPALLRKNNPDSSDEEIALRLKDIIAIPSTDPKRPSPHATGGAMDIILRFKQPTSQYVANSAVPTGHVDGDTSGRIAPDYFEHTEPVSDADKIAQRNRRAYYAIMTGAAFGIDTNFVNNPTEWWHWDRGDQLWAKVAGKPCAYYGAIELPEQKHLAS